MHRFLKMLTDSNLLQPDEGVLSEQQNRASRFYADLARNIPDGDFEDIVPDERIALDENHFMVDENDDPVQMGDNENRRQPRNMFLDDQAGTSGGQTGGGYSGGANEEDGDGAFGEGHLAGIVFFLFRPIET